MNDDDDLGVEPIDDALRRRLGGRAPLAGDPDATLAMLTPRFRRARRRHRMIVASGSALAVAGIIAVATFTATGSPGGRNVQAPPANSTRQERRVTTTVPTPAPTTSPQPSEPSVPDGSTRAPASDGGTVPSVPEPSSSVPPAPLTKTYSSTGGSVTVRVENGALSIVSTQPASDYSEERTDTGPVRVEVRFTNASGREWRIRVDLSNGEPQAEITQHGS